MSFLPEDYNVPNKPGNYVKLQDGENRFRILASPILGWESWENTPDGGRKPVRRRMDKPFQSDEVEDPEKVKHFWAMPVWNYQDERVQILEVTQKGIQKSLRALAKDEDWGSPMGYDIVITKSGQKLDTEYQVNPKPQKKLDEGIVAMYEGMNINLDALYAGDDPFKSEKVDPDEVDKGIKASKK